MGLLGLPFEVLPSNVEEVLPPEHPAPARLARQLARAKAREVADRVPERLVIGADTIVVVDHQIFGKPREPADARRMLTALSGRSHRVITGVAVINGLVPDDPVLVAAERTRVEFRPLTAPEIQAYVATGEPMDKAGAYAIQGHGAILIAGIHGDYPNVVGLPVMRLAMMLRSLGIRVLGG